LLARRMLAAATTAIAGAIFLAGPAHAADAGHSTTSTAVEDKFDGFFDEDFFDGDFMGDFRDFRPFDGSSIFDDE
jgi:hypothetical protein